MVYKVRRKKDSQNFVLKQIDTTKMNTAQRRDALKETTILKALQNQYIVRYVTHFSDRKQINIIMEYCDGGDLGGYMKRQMGHNLSESKIWKFFIQICLGIQYLHSRKILHRDIKTINMFLMKDESLRVGDLGVAKMLN